MTVIFTSSIDLVEKTASFASKSVPLRGGRGSTEVLGMLLRQPHAKAKASKLFWLNDTTYLEP